MYYSTGHWEAVEECFTLFDMTNGLWWQHIANIQGELCTAVRRTFRAKNKAGRERKLANGQLHLNCHIHWK